MPRTITILLLISVCSLFAGCASNPVTGKSQLMLVSPNEEIALGQQYAPEIQKQLGGPIDNPRIQSYISGVGQKIARISHNPTLAYHFVAVNDESINAMALPGGYIFITKGMLAKLTTEAQLAAVLSHEIVHVTARHSADAMSKQIGMSILLSALSEKTSETTATIAQLGAQILDLKYSRTAEYEADTFGLDYMVRAGYDPNAMYRMMQMLNAQNNRRPIEFFSTHPNPENRMENIQEKLNTMNIPDNLKTAKEDYKKHVLQKL